MGLEKTIVKSEIAADKVFDYKPREFTMEVTAAAVDYVHDEEVRKSDFKISEHAAQQSGVTKLEDERSQGIIDEQVLIKLKEIQERAYKGSLRPRLRGRHLRKALKEKTAEMVERISEVWMDCS